MSHSEPLNVRESEPIRRDSSWSQRLALDYALKWARAGHKVYPLDRRTGKPQSGIVPARDAPHGIA